MPFWNLNLISNLKDEVGFLTCKYVKICNNFSSVFVVRNMQVTFAEKLQIKIISFLKSTTMISYEDVNLTFNWIVNLLHKYINIWALLCRLKSLNKQRIMYLKDHVFKGSCIQRIIYSKDHVFKGTVNVIQSDFPLMEWLIRLVLLWYCIAGLTAWLNFSRVSKISWATQALVLFYYYVNCLVLCMWTLLWPRWKWYR